MVGGVGPDNRRDVQTPNYITNVQQFLVNEQYIREIISLIEKSVKENGRALSKVEARVLNLGKGITDNYSRISDELKSSGRTNVNKNEAQLLKTSIDDLFKDLRLLIQSKPSGIGKNERADESWKDVAQIGGKLADNITQNLERVTSVMGNIIDFQKEAQKIVGNVQQQSSPTGAVKSVGDEKSTSNLTDMERIGRARTKGVIGENLSRRLGYIFSNNLTKSSTPKAEPQQNYFTTLSDIYKQDRFRKAKLDSERIDKKNWLKNHPFGGAVSGATKKSLNVLSTQGTFFNQLHKTVGSLPVVGKVTGGLNMASKASTAGASILGTAGAALGAIAVGVSLIHKNMKKASPVLQAVSNLFELAWNLLWMPLGNALGTLLLPMAEDLINFAIAFNELFTDFSMEKLGEVFYMALQFIWGALYDIGNALPTMIVDFIIDGLINLFKMLGWDGAVSALENFKNILTEVREFIRNLPMKLWDYVKGFWQGVFDFFKDPIGKLRGLASIIGDAIGDAIGNVGDSVGGFIDSINPFATGGIVTGPTLGLVGEAGPEAIIPLDKANGVGTTYVINIQGDVYGVNDLETRIERVIQRTANKSYYR